MNTDTHTEDSMSVQSSNEGKHNYKRTAWQLFRYAFEKTIERKDLIGWYSLVYIGLMFLIFATGAGGFILYSYGVPLPLISIGGFVLVLVWIVVSVIAAAALIFSVVQSKHTSYWSGWKLAWPNVLSLVWLGLLTSAILLPAAMLFVIPAIILGVYLALAQLIFAKEGRRGLNAMARSFQLIYGHWWSTMGRFALMMLAVILMSIVNGLIDSLFSDESVAGLIAVAINVIFQSIFAVFVLYMFYGWYEELSAKVPADEEQITRICSRFKIGIWVGAIAVLVLPLIASFVAFTVFKDDIIHWYIGKQFESQFDAGHTIPVDIDLDMDMNMTY